VPVQLASETLPKLVEIARPDGPVVLTQDGQRVAVLVAWDQWALLQERDLHVLAASWAAWRDGTLDAVALGQEIAQWWWFYGGDARETATPAGEGGPSPSGHGQR